jgi:diguanylate cyclase (GGDEF)-like protein
MIRISEFAVSNSVTAKMLRHYDEIGLFRPVCIDPQTGYRLYSEDQSKYLNWITLLKELGFSLKENKGILQKQDDPKELLKRLKRKRIEISDQLNTQLNRTMQISRLIQVIEKEGFKMDSNIDLLSVTDQDVLEIMKSMPNMGYFLEKVKDLHSSDESRQESFFIRTDLRHFKEVNDLYGYEAGDRVISWFYELLRSTVSTFCEEFALARAGGDEFIVFAFGDRDRALQIVNELLSMLESLDPDVAGLPRSIQCYAGIVVTCTSQARWREALGHVHEAMYASRDKSGNTYELTILSDQ